MDSSFTVHSAWEDIRENVNRVTWYKHVWFFKCIPKHAFIPWLAIKGRLLTQDRILKWDPNLKSKCALWNEVYDSRDHLFFTCIYSLKVWDSVKTMVQIDNCIEDWNVIMNHVTMKAPTRHI